MQRALNYYEHISMDDNDAEKLLNKGICKLIGNKPRSAIKLLDSANAIYPTSIASTFRGIAYQAMFNKEEEMIEAYSDAIVKDSANWVAVNYRGQGYMVEGDLPAAYNDYESLIKLKPKMKEGYKNRGIILLKNNYFAKAYRDFTKAIYLDTTDYDLYFNRS